MATSSDSLICTCGALKVKKVGTREVDGHELCNQCGRPLQFTSAALAAAAAAAISPEMVTSLEGIPGYEVVAVHGVIIEVASSSGFTAGAKGRDALTQAMAGLRAQATERSANGIIGLQASTFGAGGGITNALGGDAVGVLLLGTAVTVTKINEPTI